VVKKLSSLADSSANLLAGRLDVVASCVSLLVLLRLL